MNFKQLYKGIVKRGTLITGLTGIVIGGLMLKPYVHLPEKLDNQTTEYETNNYSKKDSLLVGLGFGLSLLSLGLLEHYSRRREEERENTETLKRSQDITKTLAQNALRNNFN